MQWHATLFLAAIATNFFSADASANDARSSRPDQPTADTVCGPVKGTGITVRGRAASQFLGIPFAAPPVGRMRWRPATPAKCWSGTLNATQQPHMCMQMKVEAPVNQTQSEDCLYLNVWSTGQPRRVGQSAAGKAPVLVWIYGGDSNFGSTESYGPLETILGQEGAPDMVLVAIQYRLAGLGWLALRELTAGDPRGTSGNYGVTDCQMALRWVQENIAGFGGDPGRVTVMGQSSGGTQILAMLASPASKGLFHAAISLSGSPNITMDLAAAESQGEGYVERAGCAGATSVLDCLYGLNSTAAVHATPESWDPSYTNFPRNPHPPPKAGEVIVDGATVTRPLGQALRAGMMDVTLVLATMSAEMSFVPNATVASWKGAQAFDSFCSDEFAGYPGGAAEQMPHLYRQEAAESPALAYYSALADVGVTCAFQQLGAEAAQGFSRPVYVMYNNQPPAKPFPLPAFGSTPMDMPFHAWDFICGFGLFSFFSNNETDGAPDDLALGAKIRQAWFDIMQTGAIRPSSRCSPVVPVPGSPFPTSTRTCLVNVNASSVEGFKQATCSSLGGFGFSKASWWWVN